MSVFLACEGFRICLYVKLLNLAVLQDIFRREDYYEQITIAEEQGIWDLGSDLSFDTGIRTMRYGAGRISPLHLNVTPSSITYILHFLCVAVKGEAFPRTWCLSLRADNIEAVLVSR